MVPDDYQMVLYITKFVQDDSEKATKWFQMTAKWCYMTNK